MLAAHSARRLGRPCRTHHTGACRVHARRAWRLAVRLGWHRGEPCRLHVRVAGGFQGAPRTVPYAPLDPGIARLVCAPGGFAIAVFVYPGIEAGPLNRTEKSWSASDSDASAICCAIQ